LQALRALVSPIAVDDRQLRDDALAFGIRNVAWQLGELGFVPVLRPPVDASWDAERVVWKS
jgi:hypothetical protein